MKKLRAARLRRANQLSVEGATAADGTLWIGVSSGARQRAWVPLPTFMGTGSKAADLLSKAGVVLLSHRFRTLQALVADLVDFPPRPHATRPGRLGSSVALPSGTTIHGDPDARGRALYPVFPHLDAVSGSLDDWHQGVARRVAGHPVATVAVASAFVSPLVRLMSLDDNFGLELVGSGGTGVAELVQLAASVVGSPDRALLSRNVVARNLDHRLGASHDFPLFIEHDGLAPRSAGVPQLLRSVDWLAALRSGEPQRAPAGAPAEPSRSAWLSSHSKPLAHFLASLPNQSAMRETARIITLDMSRNHPFGVFSHLPAGYVSVDQLMERVLTSARQNHGHAYRRFLTELTKAIDADEGVLVARIQRRIDQFVSLARSGSRQGFDARTAEMFGLVFAAGWMAKRFGALPRRLPMLDAVRQAYVLHKGARRAPALPIQQLVGLLAVDGVLDLRTGLGDPSPPEVEAAAGVIRAGTNGDELILTRAHLHRLTQTPVAFMKDSDVRRALVRDGGHNTAYRELPHVRERRRYYVFRVDVLREYESS